MASNAQRNERIVITPFPTGDKVAMEVIDSVMGQLSDGMWENSNNKSITDMWSCTDVEDDGKNIILKIYDSSSYSYGSKYNSWFNADEKKIFNYIADHAKQVVKYFEKEDGPKYAWDRMNKAEASGFGGHGCPDITISDVYRVYDGLKGRKNHLYEIPKEGTKTVDQLIKDFGEPEEKPKKQSKSTEKPKKITNDSISFKINEQLKDEAKNYLDSLTSFSKSKEFKDDINGKMRDAIRVQISSLSTFINAIEKQESLLKNIDFDGEEADTNTGKELLKKLKKELKPYDVKAKQIRITKEDEETTLVNLTVETDKNPEILSDIMFEICKKLYEGKNDYYLNEFVDAGNNSPIVLCSWYVKG